MHTVERVLLRGRSHGVATRAAAVTNALDSITFSRYAERHVSILFLRYHGRSCPLQGVRCRLRTRPRAHAGHTTIRSRWIHTE